MLGAQAVLLVLVGGAVALLGDHHTALSVLAGGGTMVAAQAWFARRFFRYRGARRAREVVQGLYRGTAGKWLFCASMLAVLMAPGTGLNAAAVLLGFAGMQLVHLASLACMNRCAPGK